MPASPSHAQSPLLVLVADDSPVARLTLTRRLRAEGFEVVEQASAALPPSDVVARLGCALLDLDLGDGDGTDVARALLAQRPELPVAFFSATGSPEDVARASELGSVFAKPEELAAAVKWVAGKAGG